MNERNEQASCPTFRTSIGGQALIEGILMRGPKKQAIVVRTKDGLLKQERELTFLKDRYPVLGWPFIRGTVNFIGSMVNGVKALLWSAEQLPEEEQEEPSKFDRWLEKRFGVEKAEKLIVGFAVILGAAIAIGLFILLPAVLATLLMGVIRSNFAVNLCEGLLRIAIFLGYMVSVSRMKDIRRLWMYHGAEHKTIFCYEAGLPLTVDNCRRQSRFHPRCGTSFLFIVMITSILVFSLVSWQGGLWTNPFFRVLIRLALLPVVVGISYEIIKYAGGHDNLFTKIASAPGKALQHITTAEPDDDMLEVAIAAMEAVIPEERGSDKW